MACEAGWLLPYCSSDGCLSWRWLWCWQVGSWLEESKKTHSQRSTAVCTCMQGDRARVILITRACLGSQASTCAKWVWSRVTLFIAYSFSCNCFDCILCKKIHNQNNFAFKTQPTVYRLVTILAMYLSLTIYLTQV